MTAAEDEMIATLRAEARVDLDQLRAALWEETRVSGETVAVAVMVQSLTDDLRSWKRTDLIWTLLESLMDDGHYLSTACYHERMPGRNHLHDECESNVARADGTAKVAGECKYGAEKCRCPRHAWNAPPSR